MKKKNIGKTKHTNRSLRPIGLMFIGFCIIIGLILVITPKSGTSPQAQTDSVVVAVHSVVPATDPSVGYADQQSTQQVVAPGGGPVTVVAAFTPQFTDNPQIAPAPNTNVVSSTETK